MLPLKKKNGKTEYSSKLSTFNTRMQGIIDYFAKQKHKNKTKKIPTIFSVLKYFRKYNSAEDSFFPSERQPV